MVRLGEKFSLFAAACCSVLVVKGGDGLDLEGFSCTLVTDHALFANRSIRA